jgi:hypothetical protein
MARAKNIGTIFAELSLRDGKFIAGLKTARVALNRFGAQAIKSAAMIGGTAAAGLGAAMIAGTKRALDQADALGDLATSTGVAVSDLMGLRQAYKEGGLSAEKAASDINKMQKSIADGAGGDAEKMEAFAQLGLDLKEIINLSPADQFERIGKAIMDVDNMAQRVSLARDIFGKSGGGLLSVFDNVEEARKSLGRMPEVAERFADAMGRANDLIGRLPNKSDQFFTGFTAGIIGQLLPALEMTNAYDFTTLGENIGKKLSTALEILTNGDIWNIFSMQAEKAIYTIQASPAFNGFAASLNALFDSLTGSGSLAENYEKYATAGIAANTEIIDNLDMQIAFVLERNRAKGEAKRDAAEAIGGGTSQADDIASALQIATKTRELPSMEIEANEYQRRGLSLNTVAAPPPKVEEQVDLLKKLNAGLDRVLGKMPIGASY